MHNVSWERLIVAGYTLNTRNFHTLKAVSIKLLCPHNKDNEMNDISLPTATLMRIVRDQLSQGNLLNRDAKSDIGKACAIFTIYLSST